MLLQICSNFFFLPKKSYWNILAFIFIKRLLKLFNFFGWRKKLADRPAKSIYKGFATKIFLKTDVYPPFHNTKEKILRRLSVSQKLISYSDMIL